MKKLINYFDNLDSIEFVSAHCDIPCKIYDPIVAQIGVLTMIRVVDIIEELNTNSDASLSEKAQFSRLVAQKEEHGIKVIGIPGTIDNDLLGTRCTLGYDTALNTAVNAIDKIRDTASSHNRLFFIEVMGKGSGHIALNAGIGAGAEEVLIPEQNMGLDRLLESLSKSEKSGKSSSIIVVSEGEKIGDNVFKFSSYIEKNLPHYEIRVSILGHIQRGGTPSCFDRVLASRMGVFALDCLIEQKSKIMVGIIDDKMVAVPLTDAIKGGQELDKDLVRVCDIISI
jgi:6-phosphofructokinase 1